MSDLTHLDAAGRARMVDVGGKPPQRRIARAAGSIALAPATVELIRNNRIGKGNVLTVAEIAGIQAAKRTGELIPLCHPLVLDYVSVRLELLDAGATATGEVSCDGRTGVEMEALTAVSVALLTVYDMCKAVDKGMQIGPIVLLRKEKHNLGAGAIELGDGDKDCLRPLRCLVITLSDRAAAGVYADRSGPRVRELLDQHFANRQCPCECDHRILPDCAETLRREILSARDRGFDVIITTGGTGVGPRDIAPETIIPLCDKLIPGIMEHLRAKFGQENPRARLSRTVAGVIGTTQIYALPGSVRAVEEYMPEILATLEHVDRVLHGVDAH
jgi:cyclic pyranopterin monophosphate synthase